MAARCTGWSVEATPHALICATTYITKGLVLVNVHLTTTWRGDHDVAQALSDIDEKLGASTRPFNSPDIIITGDSN